ncbi:MAG TPA: ABC transporter substrate-binding protein, partial [Gaiellaceae bacterium]|nr:ABC transporter substrate-binding protein [Gaiellaceae bacterium]
MRIKTLWLLLAMLVASLALVAAGCGGDDGGDAAGTGTEQEEQEGGGDLAAEQVITVNWGTEPPSLDPGLATDTTSSNILTNIMDPLIKLDDELNPVPYLAESIEASEDGLTYTIVLREGGKWTNGDPVTAGDFEYAWKRTISPELAADYAYQLYGIKGAQEYNGCEENCDALRDEVGVRAVDDRTLEVTLTSPQPW